jgi:hypothetical protein
MVDFLGGVLGGSSSAPSIDFEPQRANSGELIFDIGRLGLGVDSDRITLSVAGFSLPDQQTNQSFIAFLNEVRKFAGNTSYGDITVSFHDYVSRDVLNAITKWRAKMQDPVTGRKYPKTAYCTSGAIRMFGPSGNADPGYNRTEGGLFVYDLHNVWPTDFNPGDVDYTSDEPVRIQVRFSIDKVIPQSVAGQNL